jgi:hypothetical protein
MTRMAARINSSVFMPPEYPAVVKTNMSPT